MLNIQRVLPLARPNFVAVIWGLQFPWHRPAASHSATFSGRGVRRPKTERFWLEQAAKCQCIRLCRFFSFQCWSLLQEPSLAFLEGKMWCKDQQPSNTKLYTRWKCTILPFYKPRLITNNQYLPTGNHPKLRIRMFALTSTSTLAPACWQRSQTLRRLLGRGTFELGTHWKSAGHLVGLSKKWFA